MKSKNILFIHHSPSANTIKLSNKIENTLYNFSQNINFKMLNSLETNTASFNLVDGVIIGTTENFGYMSGLTKDFFDRCFEELKEKTQGLPIVYYIRAGLDGEGSKLAIDKILTGLRWKQVLPPLIFQGTWSDNYINQVEEYVLTFAYGIELGIY